MDEDSLASRLQVIQPVLVRFLRKKKEIEDSAKRDGKIPQELCRLCSESSRLVKTAIHPLKDQEMAALSPFLKWMEDNKIIAVKETMQAHFGEIESGKIEVEAKEPIGKRKQTTLGKGTYHYSYPLSEMRKRPFYSALIGEFDGIQSCPHFDPSSPRVVRLCQTGKDLDGEEMVSDHLFFCCNSCSQEKETVACEMGATKKGFIYSVNCDLDGLVLEKILREEDIEYDKGEKPKQESVLFFPSIDRRGIAHEHL